MFRKKTYLISVLTILFLLPFLLNSSPAPPHTAIDASQMLVIEGSGPEYMPPSPRRISSKDLPVVIDFNGDRKIDTVVGSPRITELGLSQVGAINVVNGLNRGFTLQGNKQYVLRDAGFQMRAGDFFGSAVGVTDLNGDELTDIIVGVSGYDTEFGQNVGGVVTFLGTRSGRLQPGQAFWGKRPSGLLGTAITTGDFNGDGVGDFAASEPNATVNGKTGAGAVQTFYGSPGGPVIQGRTWHLASPGVKGALRANAFFGRNLFSADINNDNRDDLWIHSIEPDQTGSITVLYGGSPEIRAAGNQRITLRDRGPNAFGFSLAACYCNEDDFADTLFGAPRFEGERGGTIFLPGSRRGVTNVDSRLFRGPAVRQGDHAGFSVAAAGIQGWTVIGVGVPDADVQVGSRFLEDGGFVDWFIKDPIRDFEFTQRNLGAALRSGRNSGDRMGFTLNYSFDRFGDAFSIIGFPGARVQGRDNAGAFLVANFDRNYNLLPRSQTFNRLNLAGSPRANDFFSTTIPTGLFGIRGDDDDY